MKKIIEAEQVNQIGDQRIAVVDYSKTMRTGLAEKLQSHYSNVEAYETGRELLRILEKTDTAEHPELVLISSDMLGITGMDTCREIREKYGGGMKILGMIAEKLNAAFFIEAGADGTINKARLPRDDDYLISEVRQALGE